MTQHLRYVKTAARCPDHIIPIFMLGGTPEAYEVSSGLASNRIVSMRLFKSGAKLTRESPTLLMPTIISLGMQHPLKANGYPGIEPAEIRLSSPTALRILGRTNAYENAISEQDEHVGVLDLFEEGANSETEEYAST